MHLSQFKWKQKTNATNNSTHSGAMTRLHVFFDEYFLESTFSRYGYGPARCMGYGPHMKGGWRFLSLICKCYIPQEQQVKQFVWYRFPMAWQAWLAPYTPFPHLTQIPVGDTFSVSWANYSVCNNRIKASYIQCGKEISWDSLYIENYSSSCGCKAEHCAMCEHTQIYCFAANV